MTTEGHDPSSSWGAEADPDPLLGQVLDGRYRILAKLGEGGMGEVYAAEHLRIEKRVAVKLLRKEILTNQEAVDRFFQEALATSKIGHPNIIGIEDCQQLEDGRIYLAMELLKGQPLNDLLDEGSLSPERMIDVLVKTGHGLAAAHAKNIVHRDMKPENIFITRSPTGDDVPKLLDFGIAKVSGADGNNHLTRTGTIFGTPFYMSPEQALGQSVDHRADIYAVGVIMYEMFCGAVPYQGESFMGILTQHITAEPTLPSLMAQSLGKAPLPAGVENIILKAMKKDPNQRFQTMDEMVVALVQVYRQLVGSGRSSYMEAHKGVRPATIAAQAPPPQRSAGFSVGSTSSSTSGATPAMVDTAPPVSAPHAGYALPYSPGDSSYLEVPKRNRTGLWVVLSVLMLGGAGSAVYFLAQKKEGGTGAQGGVVRVVASDAAPVAKIEIDAAIALPADAAVEVAVAPVDAAPVAPKLVKVLLGSHPINATVYVDGEKWAERTPTIVPVVPNTQRSIVLKLRRYNDETLVLDGSEQRVTPRLRRVKTPSGGDPGNGGEDGGDDGSDEGGDEGGGTDPVGPVDPCQQNPNLPQCMLE